MRHELDTALRGIIDILVTPYDDGGRIAPDTLAPILDRALGAGRAPVLAGVGRGIRMNLDAGPTGEVRKIPHRQLPQVAKPAMTW